MKLIRILNKDLLFLVLLFAEAKEVVKKLSKPLRFYLTRVTVVTLLFATFIAFHTPLVTMAQEAATSSAQTQTETNTMSIVGENSANLKLNSLQTSAGSANKKFQVRVKKLNKENFRAGESIKTGLENATASEVSIQVIDNQGNPTPVQIVETENASVSELEIKPTDSFVPGKFTLKTVSSDGSEASQDFTWGVLAINTNKSIYLPKETVNLAMAVLDETGNMVCDALFSLEIQNPKGEKTILSTEEGTITINPDCFNKNVTQEPDYEANFSETQELGNYVINLSAQTKNGSYSITDSFEVSETVKFDVERFAPTRIYPPNSYPVNLKITANEDFTGTITELLPREFQVTTSSEGIPFDKNEAVNSETVEEKVENEDFVVTQPFLGTYSPSLGFGQPITLPETAKKYAENQVVANDGLDFPLPIGTKVLATDDGEIIRAKENSDYSTTIVIQHSWGRSYYGYLGQILVGEGVEINRGDEIALSGSLEGTPNLHFALKPNSNDKDNGYFGKVDPAYYLGLKNVPETSVENSSGEVGQVQVLTWDVSIKAGQTITLAYNFKAPDISPQFYTTGPLSFFNQENELIFNEQRVWQIAADALPAAPIVLEGMIAFDEDGANSPASPQFREWEGSDFGSEQQLANYPEVVGTHGEIRFAELKANPVRDEFLYAANTAQGHLQVQTWSNGVWTNWGDFNTGMGTARDERWFDIAYEDTSGDGLIVYEDTTTDNATLKYQTWNGTSWSGEQTLDYSAVDEGNGETRWVVLESDDGTNNILVGFQDLVLAGLYGARWDGSAWQHITLINGASVDGDLGTLTYDVAWEGSSGDGMIAYGTGTTTDFSTYTTGGGFADGANMVNVGAEVVWLKLEGDVDSDYIGAGIIDTVSTNSADMNVDMWNGSNWTTITTPTSDLDINNNGDGFAIGLGWEQNDDRMMITYRDISDTDLRYFIFDISAGQFQVIDDDGGLGICSLTGGDGTTQQVTDIGAAENSGGPCSGLGNWPGTRVTNVIIKEKSSSGDMMLVAMENSAPYQVEAWYWDGAADTWLAQTSNMGAIEVDASDGSTGPPIGKPYDFQFKSVNIQSKYPLLTQDAYIWENDDEDEASGDSVDENTQQAAGNTAITNVKKGERLTLRSHLKNSGTGALGANLGVFYDRNDGIWSQVKNAANAITGNGNCTNTNWDCTTVHNNISGLYSSVAVDKSGRPWVSYYESPTTSCNDSPTTECSLVVARYVGSGGTGCTSSAWTCEYVDNPTTTGNRGQGTSIIFDNTGIPWILYGDTARVARYVGSSGTGCTGNNAWSCEQVDINGAFWVGEITFDSSNIPWISYSDGSNLAVATRGGGFGSACTDTDWTCGDIDANGSPGGGHYSGIAVDPTGKVWVSHYDASGTQLTVANYVSSGGTGCSVSSAWTCEDVDNTGTNTGDYNSIAIDPSGKPWVSYYDATNDDLRVATRGGGFGSACTDTDWNCGVVNDSSWSQGKTNIVFNPAGQPWVGNGVANAKIAAYVGSGGSGCGGGGSTAWNCNTITTTTSDGSNNLGLAFSNDGIAWVSYQNTTNGALAVASTRRGGEILTGSGLAGTNGDSLSESHADMTTVSDTTERDDSGTARCVSGTGVNWNNGKWFEAEEASNLSASLPVGSVTNQCTEVAWIIDTSQAQPGVTYRFVIASKDAWNDSKGVWRGPIAVSSGAYPTLTIESGTPSKIYSKDNPARFSSCTDTNWGCVTVDTQGASTFDARFNSAAVDNEGNFWGVSARNTDKGLYAYKYTPGTAASGTCGANWTCTRVQSDGGTTEFGVAAEIAIGPDGSPWIVSQDWTNKDMYVAKYVGSGGTGCGSSGSTAWTCSVVDSGPGSGVDEMFGIDIDNSGNPWIVYADVSNALRLARYTPGSTASGTCSANWNCTLINDEADDVSHWFDIDISPNGSVWVTYNNVTDLTLNIAWYVESGGNCTGATAGQWSCEVLDNNMGSFPTSIAVDSTYKPWVSYKDTTSNTLNVAEYVGSSGSNCTSTAWTCENVDDIAGDVGNYSDLAIDSTNTPWVSYTDVSNSSLKAARRGAGAGSACSDTDWTCTTVDNSGTATGDYSAIAIDKSDIPWILYQDVTNGDAEVAKLHLSPTKNPLRYLLDRGDSSSPIAESCDSTATREGYCGLISDNGEYDSITSIATQSPIYNFATKNANNTDELTATWIGVSTVSAATQNIILEVFNFTTNSWETKTTTSSGCSGSDCTISSNITTSLSSYYELVGSDYYTYWRIYQGAAAETLSTDSFAMTFTPPAGGGGPTLDQLMRHGKWFNGTAEQPFTF